MSVNALSRKAFEADFVDLISEAQDADVLCGRGKNKQHHPGNQAFLRSIHDHKQQYDDALKGHKMEVVYKVINYVVDTMGGRFLLPKDGKFFVLSQRRMEIKTSQAFRDMSPRRMDAVAAVIGSRQAGRREQQGQGQGEAAGSNAITSDSGGKVSKVAAASKASDAVPPHSSPLPNSSKISSNSHDNNNNDPTTATAGGVTIANISEQYGADNALTLAASGLAFMRRRPLHATDSSAFALSATTTPSLSLSSSLSSSSRRPSLPLTAKAHNVVSPPASTAAASPLGITRSVGNVASLPTHMTTKNKARRKYAIPKSILTTVTKSAFASATPRYDDDSDEDDDHDGNGATSTHDQDSNSDDDQENERKTDGSGKQGFDAQAREQDDIITTATPLTAEALRRLHSHDRSNNGNSQDEPRSYFDRNALHETGSVSDTETEESFPVPSSRGPGIRIES
mmetsp:Transcript_21293/g.60788  ORF Transcript_21293/g.60788 Transcript_21293/m.60788 type:complete len:454 (+) Transcript_21293:571-1932(+)|eukprot:CAMPEP_0119547964 /NCGR_PEP_ID=MMETSP1352-20130426/1979_1 /TAXON_ID=265584 /ORGANISM="Stauroneis constricta, Strain CCMP1120" /LENGTH=453 /DNA_ID=CAMNT_0007593087 /DNA_START=414 /DNA_END=1775 /DNA_ORIENTATION=+